MSAWPFGGCRWGRRHIAYERQIALVGLTRCARCLRLVRIDACRILTGIPREHPNLPYRPLEDGDE